MKKIFLFLIAGIIVFSMCSCSDFGFNPTGQWKFVSDILYADGKEIDAAFAQDNDILDNMFIVFEKSGTGYISSYGEKVEVFKYSYDNETVRLTYQPNEYHKEVEVEFKPSKDGKTISRIIVYTENNVEYKEENLYKRV